MKGTKLSSKSWYLHLFNNLGKKDVQQKKQFVMNIENNKYTFNILKVQDIKKIYVTDNKKRKKPFETKVNLNKYMVIEQNMAN